MVPQRKWLQRAAIGAAAFAALGSPDPAASFSAVPRNACRCNVARAVGCNSLSAVTASPSSDSDGFVTDSKIVARGLIAASIIAASIAVSVAFSDVALADEFGRETEAPTLFTGETVMICKKRGPLGACLETEIRTAENDNDKASKYFRDPVPSVKERYNTMVKNDEEDASELIRRLRQQTEDNRVKNAQVVKAKTLLNDQAASFGPFDRQVVILNTDGESFTLLQNAQATRLKEAGYIKDRRFVKQPSKEVIEQALEGPDYGEVVKGFFGGGG